MAIARYYNEDENPRNDLALPGVPLRDLTDEEFAELPTWLQESVDASPLYRKTKPSGGKSGRKADTGKDEPAE
jgi:hypothetical protein